MPKQQSTLVLVRKNDSVLLGLKKRGFGVGKWNGFGGKVHDGETAVQCAKRELFEESSLVTDNLEKIGFLTFEFDGDPVLLDVHVFSVNTFQGSPQESDEMLPKWFTINDIPYESMWVDDKQWFPLYLKGLKFKGYFKFLGHEKILDQELKTVADIDVL